MFRKSFLFTSLMLFTYLTFFGQSGFPYDSEWKLIDSLMNKKNLPKSALSEVNKVYAAAKKENQEAQWIKAIIYRNHLRETDDRDINQEVSELETEISAAPPRVSALLKSIEAEQLFQHFQWHRYEMNNRTTITGDTSTDITTWPVSRINQKVVALYLSSLDIPNEMKQSPIDIFDPVLIKGNVRELRPVLFDLLAYRALDYFRIGDPSQVFPENDSVLFNPALFSDAPFFAVYGFSGNDRSSNFSEAIRIYQQLLRFHVKDIHLDAWIDADISRIQYVYGNAKTEVKDSLYLNALSRITGRFPTLSVVSQAWYLQALWWSDQAEKYNPLTDSLHRFDNLKAIAFCNEAISHSELSEGKSNCERLLWSIKKEAYTINIEQVNIPDQPFRALITYKNVRHLYGRIIRMSDSSMNKFQQNADDLGYWSKLISLPAVKIMHQAIPDTKDYQQHRVEIKLGPLPVGQYALLTSSDSAFSEKSVVGLTGFYSSSIAFLKNGTEYFVLDRNSGHPLKGVKVRAYKQDYLNGKQRLTPLNTYVTDLNGHFRSEEKNYTTQKLEFSSGRDFLSTSEYVSYYRNVNMDEYRRDVAEKRYEIDQLGDNLYTDRSIYRPGQTIHFKGLLITRDYNSKKYKAVVNRSMKIFLIDVNNQKVDSMELKSNDFGSIQGKFLLPQNLLGGEFRLEDEMAKGSRSFSVEEYKRPTFYIEYDSMKNAYKLGDTIQITGSALSYAGNTIDGAKVSYRIYRETRFPYPWLFRAYPANSEKEIAHGESKTNSVGKFHVLFTALPDRSDKKIDKPIYTYRVEVIVTDLNGESRSATTSVNVSYQSFEIVSTIPYRGRFTKDSLYHLPVTTRNISGVFLKEKLTASLYLLEAPHRLIRSRYWAQPDQFVMDESEYVINFPNDEYKDETNISSWKTVSKVFEVTDSTREDGLFDISSQKLEPIKPAWYLLELRSKDMEGEEILDKNYIEIVGDDGKLGDLTYNIISRENISGEPGKSVNIYSGSDAKDLLIIRVKQGISDSASKYTFYKLSQEIKKYSIDIRESDRGGFAYYDVFVKNNRWYTSEHQVFVPWTNKELQISYQTWKDKTLPGNKEQWKIKITGSKKDQVSAEILTSMYDASLDQFKMHSWKVPDIYPSYNQTNPWNTSRNFIQVYTELRPAEISDFYPLNTNAYDALISFGSGFNKMIPGAAPGLAERNMAYKSDSNEVVIAGYGIKNKKDLPLNKNEKGVAETVQTVDNNIQIRKNFNETAFFQPDLTTDAQGNVEISFTMPDALTKWKWMVLANTKDLSFGYSEKTIVTQKELMLQTNMPRFFREGDTMLIPIKIANLSSHIMSGIVQLEWMNAINNQNMDSIVGNIKSNQPFRVNASESGAFFFPAIIPSKFNQPLLYRITAKTNMSNAAYSDGEENIIPVLSNRMLVTESLPLNMDEKKERQFRFEKLLKSANSSSLQNELLTIEYTTNPAWYAVQALPYLIEFPYECSEQTFNRFYANALAAHIVQVSPAMKAIFEKWQNTDSAALLSNLQKNEELKSVLLRETPWVLQAESESQQRKNLALLFDMIKMQQALNSAFTKLQQMQSEDGGFSWFKGGRDDRYITQYIVSGIGRLKKLKAIPVTLQSALEEMVKSALDFLDVEISQDFKKLQKSSASQRIDALQIQYLYMRSYFPEFQIASKFNHALDYYRNLAMDNWMKQPVYLQGMIALYLSRTGNIKLSKEILASLNENATNTAELGMYWKSVKNGYYWQEAPVETQALLMETFQELNADKKTIDALRYWLLQQKRTRHWPTTKATADACYALLLNGSDWLSSRQDVAIQLGNFKINSTEEKTEAGTGYLRKLIPGEQVLPEMGNIQVKISEPPSTSNPQNPTSNPSWGAVYWQYFENLDKITTAQTQLFIKKNLFIEKSSDKGQVLEEVSEKNVLKPGDKLIMRIIIKTDRDLEYVHLKDKRAACLEPVNVLSGYQWNNGLGYYQSTQDASTSFFFDRLSKGTYVFEYPVFVTMAGNYSNGITTLESMYAPEFSAHSEGIRIQVKSN